MVDTRKLQAVLERAAREGRTVTYGQLLAFFGHKVTRFSVAALCRDLGEACRRVEAAGGPDLAVLVVRKADGLPGGGYFVSLQANGHYEGPLEGPQAARFAAARQAEVFAWYASSASATPARGHALRAEDEYGDQNA